MIYPITATPGSGMMFKTDAEVRALALSLVRHVDCNGEVSYLPPTVCTPPAKNDDACRVPLAADSGLGVCTLKHSDRTSLRLFADRFAALVLLRKKLASVRRPDSPLFDAYYWAVDALEEQVFRSASSLQSRGLLLHAGVVVSA